MTPRPPDNEPDLSADAPARGEARAVGDQVLGVEGLHREVAEPRAGTFLFSAEEKYVNNVPTKICQNERREIFKILTWT